MATQNKDLGFIRDGGEIVYSRYNVFVRENEVRWVVKSGWHGIHFFISSNKRRVHVRVFYVWGWQWHKRQSRPARKLNRQLLGSSAGLTLDSKHKTEQKY